MKRDAALVIMGVIIGLVIMNVYLSDKIDELYISREKLKVELFETRERLKKIEAQWQSHRTALVHDVEVQFYEPVGNPLLELALRQEVLKLTKDIIGEELEKLPHSLVVRLLDQRIIEADGKKYRIQVRTVIMAQRITFVLRFVPLLETSEDEP